MDEKNADRETLLSFLLVDRQVYEARLWAQQWLAVTGLVMAVFAGLMVFVAGAANLSDLLSLGVVTLAGSYLSYRERRAKHFLFRFKTEEFEKKTRYYRHGKDSTP
jgi:hypothetical protein